MLISPLSITIYVASNPSDALISIVPPFIAIYPSVCNPSSPASMVNVPPDTVSTSFVFMPSSVAVIIYVPPDISKLSLHTIPFPDEDISRVPVPPIIKSDFEYITPSISSSSSVLNTPVFSRILSPSIVIFTCFADFIYIGAKSSEIIDVSLNIICISSSSPQFIIRLPSDSSPVIIYVPASLISAVSE